MNIGLAHVDGKYAKLHLEITLDMISSNSSCDGCGSGGGSAYDDLQKIEKLWGSHPTNDTPIFDTLQLHYHDKEYKPQYLDVFQLAIRSDGKTDEVVGIRRTQ